MEIALIYFVFIFFCFVIFLKFSFDAVTLYWLKSHLSVDVLYQV
jgi:hypothetical protein